MALTRVDTGLQSFPDFNRNQQLANAQIYIGVPGLDPAILANQYQAYVVQEDGTQVAVAQPIRTSAGGVPTYLGSPVQIAVAETAYSVKVLNALGSQIYYQPDNTDLALIDAAQVNYQPLSGPVTTVKDRLLAYEASGGADLIGYGAGSVADELLESETEIASVSDRATVIEATKPEKVGIISNNPSATRRDITLIGDSISQGAFALNTYLHGWARIFNRMINAEVGSDSYGFTNLLTLGSGGTTTLEIHNVIFGGPAWGAPTPGDVQELASPAGNPIRAGGVGSTCNITLPFFQNRALISYIRQPGGGTFTITVNGVLAATVNTSGLSVEWATQEVALSDANYGTVNIIIEQTGAGIVDIVGPAYLSGTVEPVFNNWSQSGRRLRNVGEAIINTLMSQSSTFVMALGHNDQGDADADNTYYAAFVQRIDWLIQYANQYNVKVVVPDFCWTAAPTSRTRAELRRLALETGGVYVNLPDLIFSGDIAISTAYLTGTINMWVDGSHPNKFGMKWVAETIAKAMGLSCTSKTDAILYHDFWLPLPLKSATGIENSLRSSYTTVSAYRRNGRNVLVKLFIEPDAASAFPIGSFSLTDSFNSKSELSLAQGQNGVAYIRNDTGAIVSVYTINASGAVNLDVYSSFINDQNFSFTAPSSVGERI